MLLVTRVYPGQLRVFAEALVLRSRLFPQAVTLRLHTRQLLLQRAASRLQVLKKSIINRLILANRQRYPDLSGQLCFELRRVTHLAHCGVNVRLLGAHCGKLSA